MQNVLTLEPSKLAFIERAEHELSAFHHAVAELYGSAEADRAAADWIEAFQSTPRSADAPLQWRRIALELRELGAPPLQASLHQE